VKRASLRRNIDCIDYVHGIGNRKLTLYIRVRPQLLLRAGKKKHAKYRMAVAVSSGSGVTELEDSKMVVLYI